MSFIDTDGRSPRFLTRAQKWAITNESAPSSSKKWLSTDTRSTRRTSASTSAKMLSAPVVAALPRSSISVDSANPPRASRQIPTSGSHFQRRLGGARAHQVDVRASRFPRSDEAHSAHRTVSQKKSDRRRYWPAATAWSYTHLPTARSSIPIPKGEKLIVRL